MKRKPIFNTSVTADEEAMRKEAAKMVINGEYSAKEIRLFDRFSKATLAIGDYMQPHYHLCEKPDPICHIRFIDLLLARVGKLDKQYVHQLMTTPTFRNHKVVFERATVPRHIKGEDVAMYKTQLLLVLVATAAHILSGKCQTEANENARRALQFGYILNHIEMSVIQEAA